MTTLKMTPFERWVWATAYGAAFARGDMDSGHAFERAVYAVQELRAVRRAGGVFGADLGESSAIEREILAEVAR